MELVDNCLEYIDKYPRRKRGRTLAKALASACNSQFPAPAALDVSAGMCLDGIELVKQLNSITFERDYSNYDQDRALEHLQRLYPDMFD